MNTGGNTGEIGVDFAKRLLEAVRETQENLRRIEIWASAMTAFSEPVPDYRPDDAHLLPGEYRIEANGKPRRPRGRGLADSAT